MKKFIYAVMAAALISIVTAPAAEASRKGQSVNVQRANVQSNQSNVAKATHDAARTAISNMR
jgi:hypothetical protein